MENTTKTGLQYDSLPATLPPSNDGIFKTMLTKPEANPALASAVAAFLGRPVKNVRLRNNDAPSMNRDGKRERYDINCVVDGDDGDQCNVEMQARNMKGDSTENEHRNIKWRSVYNLSHLHSNQQGRGRTFGNFVRSYLVMLYNYRVFNHDNKLVERFTYRNPEGRELCDAVTAIFVDLTKSKELAKKPANELTDIESWVIFLALADKPEYNDAVEEVSKRMEGIAVANEILQSISQNPDERARYHSDLMWELDREHDMAVAKKEGLEEGVEEGYKKAHQEYEPQLKEKDVAIAAQAAEIAALKAELQKAKAT